MTEHEQENNCKALTKIIHIRNRRNSFGEFMFTDQYQITDDNTALGNSNLGNIKVLGRLKHIQLMITIKVKPPRSKSKAFK